MAKPREEGQALSDDQRKHLDFIQDAVSRLAAASATTKTWALTLAVAAFGLSRTQQNVEIALAGLVGALVMAVLDGHYLREERLFRHLFVEASRGRVSVYSMDKDPYRLQHSLAGSLLSWSILGYYGLIVLVGGTAVVSG